MRGWFADDTAARFEAYGWHVLRGVDGHDTESLEAAFAAARAITDRPSFLCCRTVIGWGAPHKQGSASMHGEPVGTEEIAATREYLGWPDPPFEIPAAIGAAWDMRAAGARAEAEWRERFDAYRTAYPDLAAELARRLDGTLPSQFAACATEHVARAQAETAAAATRQSSQAALNAIGPVLPELIGGSADLTPSNGTLRRNSVTLGPDRPDGDYVHFGVREFAMSAIMNGITAHGGLIPYGGTFLVFSDYARNAVRMAALMRLGVVFVYTHDSIGLGEDGPTHQPIEQVASLRIIPQLELWRPCDAAETAVAWRAAIENRSAPTCLVLTRQAVPPQPRDAAQLAAAARGGYVLIDSDGPPEAIVIATGSEVAIAADAVRAVAATGRRVRLVSMPCLSAFERQDEAYRRAVLPGDVRARVAVEAGVREPWWRYVGPDGLILGIDRFGESAPAKTLFQHFGFTADKVRSAIEAVLAAADRDSSRHKTN